jgi:hypothetical protein
MALDELTKIILLIMSLPYVIVTIFLLLFCFCSILEKFANKSDVYGETGPEFVDMEKFANTGSANKKKKKALKPVRARVPIIPEQQDNQDQVFLKNVNYNGAMPESPLYFFENPGICQQTRFDTRNNSDDSGRAIYGKRQPLSALEYLEYYDSPYY